MKRKTRIKSYIEISRLVRREFPQGCCVTRVIPDKRKKKPKYGLKEWL